MEPIDLVESSDIDEKVDEKAEEKVVEKATAKKGEDKKSSILDSPKSSDSSSDEEAFEVDKILSHRVRTNKLEYRVHWKGWDDSWNQWLAVDDLNCPNPIADHHVAHPLSEKEKKAMSMEHSKKYLKLSKEADPLETRKAFMAKEQEKAKETEKAEAKKERFRVQKYNAKVKAQQAKERELEKKKKEQQKKKEAQAKKEKSKAQPKKGTKRKRSGEAEPKEKKKRAKKQKVEEKEVTHPDLAYNYIYPKEDDVPQMEEGDGPMIIMSEEEKVARSGIGGYVAAKKNMLKRKEDEDHLAPPRVRNVATEPRDMSRGYEVDRMFTELSRADKDKMFQLLAKGSKDVLQPIWDTLMREFMVSDEEKYEIALKFFHEKRFGFKF